MAHLKFDYAWASVLTLRAIRAACARSTCLALGTLGLRNERKDGKFTSTTA